jgi:hypothetical protein
VATRSHRSYADAVRDALGRLEAVGLRWYLTGSEALGPYAVARQTADTDVVVDLAAAEFERVFAPFEDAFAVARPIPTPGRWLASLVSLAGWGKIDVILREDDPWGRAALDRRRRFDHPDLGPVWLSSPEDLLLAKLDWSEGTSELQLRDCITLLRANPGLDRVYLDRHASALGLTDLLARVRSDAA